jgi:hypothetical protein
MHIVIIQDVFHIQHKIYLHSLLVYYMKDNIIQLVEQAPVALQLQVQVGYHLRLVEHRMKLPFVLELQNQYQPHDNKQVEHQREDCN